MRLKNASKNIPTKIFCVLVLTAYLVHCQVDACVGDDAQHVWDVAFVKRSKSFSPENLLRTVGDTRVLPGRPQSEASFQDLGTENVTLTSLQT